MREENRALRGQIGKRKLRLTDDERRRLAVRGKRLGRKGLTEYASFVTPDTILRWHRQLIAAKWTHPAKKRSDRPGVMKAISQLTLRMAHEYLAWGYGRIQGALPVVVHRVAHKTVKKILRNNGRAASVLPASVGLSSDRIDFGCPFARYALRQYERHYNAERTHQGIGNRLINGEERASTAGPV